MRIVSTVFTDVKCLICNTRKAIAYVQIIDAGVTINLVLCGHCLRWPEHEIVNAIMKPREPKTK